jgi:hypothetical protein
MERDVAVGSPVVVWGGGMKAATSRVVARRSVVVVVVGFIVFQLYFLSGSGR